MKVYYTYSYFYPFQYSFLSAVSILFLLFTLCLENFSSHSLSVDLLITNSHSFQSSENVFIYPSFMKYIFTEYRIPSWQFSFSIWRILCHFLLVSMISREKFTIIQMSNLSNMSFLSGCYQVFSLCLIVFNYHMSCHWLTWVYPIWNLLSLLNVYVYAFY